MPYDPDTFIDVLDENNPPPGAIPVDATALNKIEQGIATAQATAEAATFGNADVIDVRVYGVKADGVRYAFTGQAGAVLSNVAGTFTGVQPGMLALQEGGGASITRTGSTANSEQVTNGWGFGSVITLTAPLPDKGWARAVVTIPGAGVAGADLVTHIRGITNDLLRFSVHAAPSTAVSGATITITPYHRSTILSVAADGSSVTLTGAASSTSVAERLMPGLGVLIGTDNAAGITAAMTALANSTTKYGNTMIGVVNRAPKMVKWPPGTILTSETNLAPPVTARTHGIYHVGQGVGVTEILYAPLADGQFMFDDNDKWNRITFRDMTLAGLSMPGVRPGFWHSHSAGAQQGHRFFRVEWQGSWGDVFYAEGTDTNDKWSWFGCTCVVKCMDNFFHIPTTSASPPGSRQQMHYEWYGGMFEVDSGNKWNMGAAGQITDTGSFICSLEGICYLLASGTTTGTGIGNRSVVSLNQKMELRIPGCLFIDCSWDDGSVVVINPHLSEGGINGRIATDVSAVFRIDDGPGPLIKFLGGDIRGTVAFTWKSTAAVFRRKQIEWENMQFADWDFPEQAFTFTQTDAGLNTGAIPLVKLRGCHGSQSSLSPFFGNATNGSPVITGLSDTSQLWAGMTMSSAVAGVVPSGTTVKSVDSATQITMTNPAGATVSGTFIKIGVPPSDYRIAWDVDLNWHLSKQSHLEPKHYRVATVRGVMPSANGTTGLYLPKNALLRRIDCYLEPGVVASHPASGMAFTVVSGSIFLVGTTNGTAVVTGLPSTSALAAGMYASGIGIPAGATILSVDSGTQVTLSVAATASGIVQMEFFGGVTVATIAPTGDDPANGIDTASTTKLRCATNSQRSLTLIGNANVVSAIPADLLVEYW